MGDEQRETGQRVGSTSELQVGEGTQDAPVGTTLAMIDQATKVMNAVHKRLHAAQAEEFRLLVRTFKDNPESFWQRKGKPSYPWSEQTFVQALNDCELVPQADPNTASHVQRLMKVMALKQLQAASPALYDPIAIDTAALQAIGWNNPQQFLAPQGAQQQPPPELIKMQADAVTAKTIADSRMMDAQTKRMQVQQKGQYDAQKLQIEAMRAGKPEGRQQQVDTPVDIALARAKILDSHTRAKEVDIKHHDVMLENQNRDLDRHSRERAQILSMAKDILAHQNSQQEVTGAVNEAAKEAE